MAFSKPEWPRGRVDAAGAVLAMPGSPSNVSDEDLEVIKNWRAAHHFPLQVIKMMLKGRALRADPAAIVSQRMKRLPSIRNKLVRPQSATMRLSQMQDIGGCRAVMSDAVRVDKLAEMFAVGKAKNPTGRHIMVGTPKDYIGSPKPDGYRGVHYVFRYHTDSPEREAWNDLRIEIQIRSKLQHAWATAVETIDILTGQTIKFSLGTDFGDHRWRRFFALMGSVIAVRERRPIVPGTPTEWNALVGELRDVASATGAENVLTGVGEAVNTLESDLLRGGADEYLLILDSRTRQTFVKPYVRRNLAELEAEYMRLEKDADPNIQVVQVSVEDINALRAAYPSYYLDTKAFVQELRRATQADRSR